MISVIGVRFQQEGKVFQYDPGALTPAVGEYVVVETPRGSDLGEVVAAVHEVEEESLAAPLSRVLRLATPQDIQRATDNRAKEQEAFRVCNQKIQEHQLEMKLVSVEVLFDNSKMLFYFTANGRVDFRALVKDLASVFRTRIELRQIGVRDEARMLGGLGPCGRQICCGAFLSDFQPVSIRMAKEQNLSLNPTKISGVCGRLMCCLKYEQDQYEQVRKRMPRVGREVITPDGKGVVTELNIIKETVSVRIMNGDSATIQAYPMDQISRPGAAPQPSPEEAPASIDETELQGADGFPPEELSELSAGGAEDPGSEASGSTAEEAPGPKKRPRRNAQKSGPKNSRPNGNAEETEREQKQKPARNGKNDRPEKNRPPRESRFGQPVKRENPNRANAAAKNAEAGKQPDGEKPGQLKKNETISTADSKPADAGKKDTQPAAPSEPVKKQGGNAGKSKNWAAALEQALQKADG